MKFGLYARKSSEDSSKQIQSIANQVDVLREKARENSLKIVKVYQEEKSAKKPYRRDKFNQMMADLQEGVIDAVICWDLTRLSRNPIEAGMTQHFLLEGIIQQIVTYEKTYYPSDHSIMMNLELGMATEYSLALGKNVKRGLKYKIEQGHYPNTAPLGYLNTAHLNCGEKTIVIDSERAPLIRKLWDLLLKDQLSIGEIVQKAADIGLRTRATRKQPEKLLTRHGLHCIFKNPFYYGAFRWQGELHEGVHEPLISKDEFVKAQRLISVRKCAPRPAKHQYALKGSIQCGECGASVTAEQKNKIRKDGSINQRTYYRCTHRRKDSNCKQPMLREADLERQFVTILDSITVPDEFVQWAIKWLNDEGKEAQVKRDAILKQQQRQIEKLNKEIDRLLDLRLQDEVDSSIFKIKKDALMAEKHSIEKDMYLDTDSEDMRINKTTEVFDFCKRVKDVFDQGSFEDKKLVIQALGSHFYLKDKKLTVELAKPFKLIQDAVTNQWILNPRFSTLKTKTAQGESALERSLVVNGADDGS